MSFNHFLLISAIALLFFSCQRHANKTAEEAKYSKEALVKEVFVQKEIGGSQEDSSTYYLHLVLKDTIPEKVELRSITFLWQDFTLNPFQNNYKFKLKPPEKGLHQKATLRYVNKSDEVTVVKTNSILIDVPRKEDLFRP
jgi:hypothetical protein